MSTLRLRWLTCLAVGTASIGARSAAADDAASPERIEWGVGAQVRRSHVSVGIQRLFVEDSPGAATQDGVGLQFTRRVKQIEIGLGLGYDPFHGREGYYLDKGTDPTVSGNVDYVEFDDDLSWFTIDVTVVGRIPLHKILALRYGAGLGAGMPRGNIYRTSAVCTTARLQNDCELDPDGPRQHEAVDLAPVLPVINALAGVELRPFRAVALHVDVGLHTVPYVGAGLTLYLW